MSLHLGSTIHATLVYVGIKDGQSPPITYKNQEPDFFFIRLIIYLQLGYDKLQLKGVQIMHTHTHTHICHYKIPNGPFEI